MLKKELLALHIYYKQQNDYRVDFLSCFYHLISVFRALVSTVSITDVPECLYHAEDVDSYLSCEISKGLSALPNLG